MSKKSKNKPIKIPDNPDLINKKDSSVDKKGQRGAISDKTRKWILDNQSAYSVEQLAERFGLKPATIQKLLLVNLPVADRNSQWRTHLRRSVAFKQCRSQFSNVELEYFEDKFIILMSQFNDDNILETEHTQVFNIIKLEILMDRNLAGKQQLRETIEKNENRQRLIIDNYDQDITLMPPQDRQLLADLENSIAAMRASEQAKSNEYLNLHKEHTILTKLLEEGRNQRVKKIENSKISFTGLVRSLQERDNLEKANRELTLFRKAQEKETIRLSTPYRYADGVEDLPVLSAETLDLQDNIEKEEEVKRELEKIEMEEEEETEENTRTEDK